MGTQPGTTLRRARSAGLTQHGLARLLLLGGLLLLAGTGLLAVLSDRDAGRGLSVETALSADAAGSDSGLEPRTGAFEVQEGDSSICLFQSPSYWQSVAFDRYGNSFIVIDDEFDPQLGDFVASSRDFVVSYDLLLVEQRVPDEFYVIGEKRDGSLIVEKLVVPDLDGTYSVGFPPVGSAIGTAVAPRQAPATLLVGGTWIAPPDREPALQEQRELVAEGLAIPPPVAACVDPDGRFLLLLPEGGSELYQLALEPDSVPTIVLDSVQAPDLVSMGCLAVRQEASLGRVYVMTHSGNFNDGAPFTVNRIVLYDSDNDGLFEGHLTFSYDQYEDAGFVFTDAWDSSPD